MPLGHRCLDPHGRVPWIHDSHEGAALLSTAEFPIATHLAEEQNNPPGKKKGAWRITREAREKQVYWKNIYDMRMYIYMLYHEYLE